jgi:hypothetical protein
MARSSLGIGSRPLKPERRVRFPHGLLNMAKWRNRQTRDAQNVVPARAWEFESPLGYLGLQAGRAQPAVMRLVRPVRYRGLQLPTGYANRQSGEVEGLVPAGSTPAPVTGEDPTSGRTRWKPGPLVQREDAWFAPR